MKKITVASQPVAVRDSSGHFKKLTRTVLPPQEAPRHRITFHYHARHNAEIVSRYNGGKVVKSAYGWQVR